MALTLRQLLKCFIKERSKHGNHPSSTDKLLLYRPQAPLQQAKEALVPQPLHTSCVREALSPILADLLWTLSISPHSAAVGSPTAGHTVPAVPTAVLN